MKKSDNTPKKETDPPPKQKPAQAVAKKQGAGP
jgi:hypothetical protein